ncbi:MAG: hypothetical protein HYX90_02560, partial [Chloroflexi bacterium]|nr:hypothetical protein [Chloroflexota bacterium]
MGKTPQQANNEGEKEAIPSETTRRSLRGLPRLVVIGSASLAILFSILYIFNVPLMGVGIPLIAYLYGLMAFLLPLTFLCLAPRKTSSEKVPWFDWLFAAVTFTSFAYFALSFEKVQSGWEMGLPGIPLVMACIVIPLIIEASRRAAGLAFAIIVMVLS